MEVEVEQRREAGEGARVEGFHAVVGEAEVEELLEAGHALGHGLHAVVVHGEVLQPAEGGQLLRQRERRQVVVAQVQHPQRGVRRAQRVRRHAGQRVVVLDVRVREAHVAERVVLERRQL